MAGTKKGNAGKGVKHRFGQPGGNIPKPMNGDHGYPYERWSLRMASRHLAAQEIDPFDKEAIQKLIGKRKLTIAETMAMRHIQRAMNNETACTNFTNNVEGKLPEDFTVRTPDKKEPFIPSKDLPEAIKRLEDKLKPRK